MSLISAGIVFLLFVALLVFSIMSAKTWHWINIVLVNLIFISTVLASAGLSKAYYLRHRDMGELQRAKSERDRFAIEAEKSLHGSPDSILYDPDSLRYKAQQVRLTFTGRGRVWANGQIEVDGNRRVFLFAEPRPEIEAGARVQPLPLKDTELLLFADDSVLGAPYPTDYIGRVIVVAETPNQLVLQAVESGGQSEIIDTNEWANPTTSWTLFEKMPFDDNDIFKLSFLSEIEHNKENASPGDLEIAEKIRNNELDITTYRRILEQIYLPADLFNLSPDSREYEAIIDRFAFDGFSLGRIENWVEENSDTRINRQFVAADDETFIEYRFDANSKEEYIVDSATGAVVTDGPFTALGLAVDRSLHHGSAVRFSQGDVVRIDQRTAEGRRGDEQIAPFRTREEVTEIDRIYIRKLRDYPLIFNDYALRSNFMDLERQRSEALAQRQQSALTATAAQEQERANIKEGMEQDLENLRQDLVVIENLYQRRSEQFDEMGESIRDLRRRIVDQYRLIQEQSRAIEQSTFAGR